MRLFCPSIIVKNIVLLVAQGAEALTAALWGEQE
jgi:hypothetical protein